jgi:hypothetical protein
LPRLGKGERPSLISWPSSSRVFESDGQRKGEQKKAAVGLDLTALFNTSSGVVAERRVWLDLDLLPMTGGAYGRLVYRRRIARAR